MTNKIEEELRGEIEADLKDLTRLPSVTYNHIIEMLQNARDRSQKDTLAEVKKVINWNTNSITEGWLCSPRELKSKLGLK